MPSNLAVADAALKTVYGNVHEQLEDRMVALKLVEGGAKHIDAATSKFRFLVNVGRTRGIGSRKESQNLPSAGAAKDVLASGDLKFHYGAIEGTGQTFELATTNTASFVDWMRREADQIITTLERDLNRQVYGNGTGTLATLTTAATTATSLVVDSVHFLEIGMTLDVLTAATLGNAEPTSGIVQANTVVEITAINEATDTITVAGGTVTAAAGSVLVIGSVAGGRRDNNWNNEWVGLGTALSTTASLHGISPTAHPVWSPAYVNNSVGTLTELELNRLVQQVHRRGGNVTDLLTTWGVTNAYWATLEGQRRYDGTEKMVGGVQVPVFQSVFGNIPITADWYAPEGTVHAINKKEMYIHRTHKWQWMDKDGSKWRKVPYKDAWEATVSQYSNLGFTRRNSFGKLGGITES